MLTSCHVACTILVYSALLADLSPGVPEFSPDASTVAWVQNEYTVNPLNFEKSVSQRATVRWSPVSSPATVQSVHLLSVGPDYGGYQLDGMIHLVFSPDARYIAAAGPKLLKALDTSSARASRIAPDGEIVTSLVWLSNDEVAYSAHTQLRGEHHTTDRTIWRQRIGTPVSTRVQIHHDEGVDAGFSSAITCFNWPIEYWSPKGSYVLFQRSQFEQFRLLEQRTGRLLTFGPANLYPEAIAWKRDESMVAIIAGIRGPEGKFVALLVEPGTGRITDFTKRFNGEFPHPALRDTAWTGDGRYLLTNDLDNGGCLIQPEPFRCVRVADRLSSRQSDGNNTHKYKASVHAFGTPGYVRARDPDSIGYIVDYEGKTFLRLDRILGTWSYDGSLAAVVGSQGRLQLQRVRLPELKTTSAPAKQLLEHR